MLMMTWCAEWKRAGRTCLTFVLNQEAFFYRYPGIWTPDRSQPYFHLHGFPEHLRTLASPFTEAPSNAYPGPLSCPPLLSLTCAQLHHDIHHAILLLGLVRSLLTWRHPSLKAGQERLADALATPPAVIPQLDQLLDRVSSLLCGWLSG